MRLFSVIGEAVQTIQSNESNRKRIASQLSELRLQDFGQFDSPEVQEDRFVFPVSRVSLNNRISASDSGFVSKSLHSVDLVLIRAVGVLFEYQNNRVARSRYWPGFFDFPQPFLSNHALDTDELLLSRSMLRLQEEIRVAKQMIVEEKPDFCLVDGSLVPQYADKPRSDSKLSSEYRAMLDSFVDLFETAEKAGVELVGCVEDSRGSRFSSILNETILPYWNRSVTGLDGLLDSVLLDHVLQQNERSFAFPYTRNWKEHAILNEMGEKWPQRLFACYVKPSEWDRPLRFEFLHSDSREKLSEHVNRIASVLLSMASLHREYAYPSVLIEADLHARLKPDEVDIVFNKICDQLSKKVRMQLRRNSRPF